jgi:hypothetical protein
MFPTLGVNGMGSGRTPISLRSPYLTNQKNRYRNYEKDANDSKLGYSTTIVGGNVEKSLDKIHAHF